jgi:GT2 family glycosyltransferase
MDDPTTEPPAAGRIGVIVVNYGAHELLKIHLAELDDQRDMAVVVVDNLHSAEERLAVTALSLERGWELLTPDRNLGFGDGNNLGAAKAIELGCDVLVLLNPDARMSPSSCRALANLARANQQSLVSPIILRPDGTVWFAGSKFSLKTGRVGKVTEPFTSGPDKWLSGAVLASHRLMWEQLGGFGPGYFLYWEDVDISRRCVDLGGQLIVATEVTAEHDVGGTQRDQLKGAGKSPIYYYYNCRNRLLFASRHLPTRLMFSWVLHTPAESKTILFRGGRRQLVKSPRVLFSATGGSLVGVAIVLREAARRAISRSAPSSSPRSA